MELPNLPPDIRFVLLDQTEDAFHYTFEVKRVAMKPHILKRWAWDEEAQIKKHRSNFAEKPFFKISVGPDAAGTVSLMKVEGYLRFGEFYLLPAYQRQGIGTRILMHCVKQANDVGKSVRLEYLKWNPVGSLYLRHGFAKINETETHWILERPIPTVTS